MVVKESSVERRLVKGVAALGWRALKFVSPGNAGVPDRIVLGPGGRVIFVELKTETGRLSPMQKRQIEALRALGHDVRVLYGVEDVDAFLKEVRQ